MTQQEHTPRDKETQVQGKTTIDDSVIAAINNWEKEQAMTQQEQTTKGKETQVQGETTIDDSVIASIAGIAAREVEGVAALGTSSVTSPLAGRFSGKGARARGVEVESGKKEAILDVTIRVIYGFSIPKIVGDVRQKVAQRVYEMTGLTAKEINIKVIDIEFPERMPGRLE